MSSWIFLKPCLVAFLSYLLCSEIFLSVSIGYLSETFFGFSIKSSIKSSKSISPPWCSPISNFLAQFQSVKPYLRAYFVSRFQVIPGKSYLISFHFSNSGPFGSLGNPLGSFGFLSGPKGFFGSMSVSLVSLCKILKDPLT